MDGEGKSMDFIFLKNPAGIAEYKTSVIVRRMPEAGKYQCVCGGIG